MTAGNPGGRPPELSCNNATGWQLVEEIENCFHPVTTEDAMSSPGSC